MSRMDHVKAAEKYVAGHKPGDVHPDVAAAMHRFTTSQERDAGPVAVLANARALVDMAELVGEDYEAPAEQSAPVQRPAKKTARRPAKKATARKRS